MTSRPAMINQIHQAELPIAELEINKKVQLRRLDKTTVREYAEAYKARSIFPNIIVFREKGSERYIVADGFHRLEASKLAKFDSISCDVYKGGPHDALKYALSANVEHGYRRTRKQAHAAVTAALLDGEFGTWSNRRVADLCRVDEKTVRNCKDDLILAGKLDPKAKTVGRDGKSYPSGAESPHLPRKPKPKTRSRRPHTMAERNVIDFWESIATINAIPLSGGEILDASKYPDMNALECARDKITEALEAARD